MGLQTKTGYSRVDRNRIFIYWFSIKLENFIINEFKTRKAGGRAYMPGRWAYNGERGALQEAVCGILND